MYEFRPDLNAAERLVGCPMADVERSLIYATLKETHGNRTHAANILGLSVRTLRNKIRAYEREGCTMPMPSDGLRIIRL